MKKTKKDFQSEIKEKVLDIFLNNPNHQYNYKQIAKALALDDTQDKKGIISCLHNLVKDKMLFEVYQGKFQLNPTKTQTITKTGPYITGRVDMKQTGKAYVISQESPEDILINPNNTNNALNGDIVKVILFPKRKNKKIEGEIIEIVKRDKTSFVGILQISKHYAFLIPDSKSMPVDIFIPIENLNNGKQGEKAIAEITDWPKQAKNPFGKITKVLGKPGVHEVEMNSILAEYELPLEFPKHVDIEAEKIPEIISKEEIASRRDFRNITTFTIDPKDAKDFDDALSIEYLKNGNFEIGVHIADVSHYVKEKSIIDEEAQNRGTSIYLVDRVIPMLPEKLSNFVCSLRPNEEKCCFSAVFEMNDKAQIIKEWFGKTVINSDRRFTYEEVQEIIEGKEGDFKKEIEILNSLAKILRDKRLKNGAIAFESTEVKFNLDDKGKPLSVYFKIQQDAHKLIEEFMLLANRKVAEKIGKVKAGTTPKTFVYRIHDVPNLEKLDTLSNFVSKLGYKMKLDTRKNISSSFNKLIDDSRGKGEENLIETLAIRSMAKAEYTTQNIGHYGLAFDFYTHFTSPIRRYPDLMVHRLLFDYLNDKKSANQEYYEELCIHASEMEKKAQEAERDSIKYKQVEFLSDKIGQVFDGLISGVSKWGIFVEIKENKSEGMIRLRDLEDDYYFLDEDNFQVIGQRRKKIYKLGDAVQIRVKKTDLSRKEIDFEFV